MAKLLGFARRFRDDERAATMVEYTLMLLFLAMACFVSVAALGASLTGLIQEAVNGMH